MVNNAMRNIYAYRYEGELSELRVEGEKAQGFEAWSIRKLLKGLSQEEEKKFIPSMLKGEYLEIYKDILKLL